MFNKIKLVLNNGQLMKRIAFTLFILFVYKSLTFITIPLVDTEYITRDFLDSGLGAYLDAFTGQGLSRFSVVAMGITPYITASIVIQLIQMMDLSPKIKELSESGETGKQTINEWTRKLAIVLSFVQGLLLIWGLNGGTFGNELLPGVEPSILVYTYLGIMMAAGTAIVLWLADQITRRGIGNGTSMIIIVGILGTLPVMYKDIYNHFINANSNYFDYIFFILVIAINIFTLVGVIYLQSSERKIPIQHSSNRGSGDANIPVKLNSAGVIPVIFAASLLSIPLFLIKAFGLEATAIGEIVIGIFTYTNPIGFILYALLIVIFSFFYSFLMLSPEKIAENLKNQNAFIPGVKPGPATEEYIARVLYKITLVGSIYLVILAGLPIFMVSIFGLPKSVSVGGTSLLIVVGVAVETTKQVEAEAVEVTHTGFLK